MTHLLPGTILIIPTKIRFKFFMTNTNTQSNRLIYLSCSIFIVRPSLKSDDISLYGKYLNCDQNGNISECILSSCVLSVDDPHGNATQALFLMIENYLCIHLFLVLISGHGNEDLPIIVMGFSRGGLVLNQVACLQS